MNWNFWNFFEGGFIAPIIRPFSIGIPRTGNKKISALDPLTCIRNYWDEITVCILLSLTKPNPYWS